MALEDLDQAEAVLNGVPAEISDTPEIDAAHAQLALHAKRRMQVHWVNCLRRLRRMKTTIKRVLIMPRRCAAGQVEEAVEQLLQLFRRDREWNEGAAKEQLFTIFDALKANDPIVRMDGAS